MPFCKVHIRRISDKIPPISGGNGVFLVDSVGVRSVSGEPDECEICHTMTMDGYILKLDGTDTVRRKFLNFEYGGANHEYQ